MDDHAWEEALTREVKAKAELRKAAANWDALSASLADFEDVSEE
jgi:hypothetical protein